jgi:hypothetical protein
VVKTLVAQDEPAALQQRGRASVMHKVCAAAGAGGAADATACCMGCTHSLRGAARGWGPASLFASAHAHAHVIAMAPAAAPTPEVDVGTRRSHAP